MGKRKRWRYTAANAIEFSDMMTKKVGWSSYGDKQYVPHVLRYYPFGRIPTGTGSQAIVQVAMLQEGNGGETYWRWFGFGSRGNGVLVFHHGVPINAAILKAV